MASLCSMTCLDQRDDEAESDARRARPGIAAPRPVPLLVLLPVLDLVLTFVLSRVAVARVLVERLVAARRDPALRCLLAMLEYSSV